MTVSQRIQGPQSQTLPCVAVNKLSRRPLLRFENTEGFRRSVPTWIRYILLRRIAHPLAHMSARKSSRDVSSTEWLEDLLQTAANTQRPRDARESDRDTFRAFLANTGGVPVPVRRPQMPQPQQLLKSMGVTSRPNPMVERPVNVGTLPHIDTGTVVHTVIPVGDKDKTPTPSTPNSFRTEDSNTMMGSNMLAEVVTTADPILPADSSIAESPATKEMIARELAVVCHPRCMPPTLYAIHVVCQTCCTPAMWTIF